jgi:transposase
MPQMENNKLDFSSQNFYLGIDVHKKSWSVGIISNNNLLKRFSMDPDPKILSEYMHRNYPGGNYFSVYEAGFSGYWIDRALKEAGINNIIVNPADIPTKNKERISKTDKIDARKLARELSNQQLESIYVPGQLQEELRSLSRLRIQLVRDQTRVKNQIKSLLMYYGKRIPEDFEKKGWSKRFIQYIEAFDFTTIAGADCLKINIERFHRDHDLLKDVLRKIKNNLKDYGFESLVEKLKSIPGISNLTAIALVTEIMDINRFKRLDELCSYVGLVPSMRDSGETEKTMGLSRRQSKYLRNVLIESSWVAMKVDPALTMSFNKLIKRMPKQKAIIKIAKKLLNRIKYVWKNDQVYQKAVVA